MTLNKEFQNKDQIMGDTVTSFVNTSERIMEMHQRNFQSDKWSSKDL